MTRGRSCSTARRARADARARRLARLARDGAARAGPRLGRAARRHRGAARASGADRRGRARARRRAASRASTSMASRSRCCRAIASSCAASRAASCGGDARAAACVLDVAPPHRRRSDPQLRRELEELGAPRSADGRRDPDRARRTRGHARASGCSRDGPRRATRSTRRSPRSKPPAASMRAGGALWLTTRGARRDTRCACSPRSPPGTRPSRSARAFRRARCAGSCPRISRRTPSSSRSRGSRRSGAIVIEGELVRAALRTRRASPPRIARMPTRSPPRRGSPASSRRRLREWSERLRLPMREAAGSARSPRARGRARARARRAVVRSRRRRRLARARRPPSGRARTPRDSRLQGADRHFAPHRGSA